MVVRNQIKDLGQIVLFLMLFKWGLERHQNQQFPNKCQHRMKEDLFLINCKLPQIRIRVQMQHFHSFCNPMSIHHKCQETLFNRHRRKGLVLNGHRVSHFPKRMFEMSCMYPWIRLSLHKPTKLLNKLIVLWPNPVMS